MQKLFFCTHINHTRRNEFPKCLMVSNDWEFYVLFEADYVVDFIGFGLVLSGSHAVFASVIYIYIVSIYKYLLMIH